MSADDDEDYWDNDDFIATIETVVKKAEDTRAARHGGTQFEPTPHSSAILRPQSVNFRSGEAGLFPSARDTPRVPEFLSSRPRDGSIAPAPWEIHSGIVYRESHGEETIVDCVGIPHETLQEGSISVQLPGGAGDVGGEIVGRYGELMAEKDGMISILRSRVEEAEQELDELRNRAGPQNLSHPSIYHQQLELERLSAQLMFKDHEINEGQRARAEKEERLKDAWAAIAALKEELEKLKKSRQTGAELKRARNEADVDLLEKNMDFRGDGIARPPESLRNISGVSKLHHGPWPPPWMQEGVSGAEGNTTTGLCLTPQVGSPNSETLKMRIGGNGSVSVNREMQSTKTVILQANESHKRGISRRADTSMTGRSDGEELPAIEQLIVYFSRTSDMYYSLQHLWGLKGVSNDGISLLSKLYASCRQDLYILFSNGDSTVVSSLRSSNRKGKEGQIEGGTISEKLHTALAKVGSGLAHPQIIISPLLEFCKLEHVILMGSALRVLRYILQHDITCRRNLLWRGSQQSADCQVERCSFYEILEEEKIAKEKGWWTQVPLNQGSNLQISHSVMFSSPRITFHPQAGDHFVQHRHGSKGLTENGADQDGQEPRRDQLQRPVSESEEAGFDDTLVPAEGLNLLVKWMLDLALTSFSPNVKLEAIAGIGVLVMNSEPLTERSMFGPLLWHGAIDLLLKESSRAEIQLEAVRIVHLLLHCPTIIQRFCAADDGVDEKVMLQSKVINDGDAGISPHLENQTGRPPVGSHDQGISGAQTLEKSKIAVCSAPHQSSYAELSNVKLLEGLTECLKYTGNSPQGYALHRSVIRLLAFIMAFGDRGTAAIIQAGESCEDPELGKTFQDDSKVERVVIGESASCQNIVGDGSGLTHLKGQDLGDKDNGIPIRLVDDSVDDFEKPKNIPQRLLALIDSELDAEESEKWNDQSIAEERDRLIDDAVTLLCRLSSDPVRSPVVLRHLISNKDMARLTLSVTNRLVSRKSHSKLSWARQTSSVPKNSGIVELARGLRGRVLLTLEETSPFSLY